MLRRRPGYEARLNHCVVDCMPCFVPTIFLSYLSLQLPHLGLKFTQLSGLFLAGGSLILFRQVTTLCPALCENRLSSPLAPTTRQYCVKHQQMGLRLGWQLEHSHAWTRLLHHSNSIIICSLSKHHVLSFPVSLIRLKRHTLNYITMSIS